MRYGLLLFCLLPLIGFAQSYRWTDEDGKVHFSDQPPPNRDRDKAEQIELKNPEPLGQGESVERTRQELEEMRRQREERQQKTRHEEKRREQQRLQECQQKSRQLSVMKNKRVLYKQEDGSYSGIPMDEHEQRISDLENWIKENCRD